jgi:hypothetical protein
LIAYLDGPLPDEDDDYYLRYCTLLDRVLNAVAYLDGYCSPECREAPERTSLS